MEMWGKELKEIKTYLSLKEKKILNATNEEEISNQSDKLVSKGWGLTFTKKQEAYSQNAQTRRVWINVPPSPPRRQ